MNLSSKKLKEHRKEIVMLELNIIRDVYDQKFGELALGARLLPHARQVYDFERLGIEPINHYEEMFKLLEKQISKENQFRTDAIKQYIKREGLEEKSREIIDGLNQTARNVTIWPDTSAIQSGNVLRCREVLLHDGKAMLEFALDYVDRWQRYNGLFRDNYQ